MLVETEDPPGRGPFLAESSGRYGALKSTHQRFPVSHIGIRGIGRGLGSSIEVRRSFHHHYQPIAGAINFHTDNASAPDAPRNRGGHSTSRVPRLVFGDQPGVIDKVEQQNVALEPLHAA